MKKLLKMLMALVLVLGCTSQAQTKMSFGPKAGVSLANLTGDDADSILVDATWKFGFSGGAFLAIDVAQQFRVQPELLYAMRGAKEDTTDAKLKLDYVAFPILLKWMAPTQGKAKPSLFVGPEVAFLMSAKFDTIGGNIDVKDSTKSVDFGIVIGGGLDLAAGSGEVTFDVRYNLGLAKIDDTPSDFSIKNSGFTAMIGYAIPIGRKTTP